MEDLLLLMKIKVIKHLTNVLQFLQVHLVLLVEGQDSLNTLLFKTQN